MLAVGLVLASGLLLAGCSGKDLTLQDAATPHAAAAPPAGTASATPPATAGPTSGGAGSGSGTTAGANPTAGTSPGTLRSSRCRSTDLIGSITEGNGGAAGSVEPYLVLTNTGRAACTLQGWPGLSLVGGGNGTQIGAPATRDQLTEHATVTLQPKHSAHAPMRLAQAGNYDTATCDPKPADGFRVFPPGEKSSLYVAAPGYTGCAKSGVKLLRVQAVRPGAA